MKKRIVALLLLSWSFVPVTVPAQGVSKNILCGTTIDSSISASAVIDESDEFWTAVRVSLLIGGIYLLYWLKAGALQGK